MMGYEQEVVARLRARLGREPTPEEIKAERDRSIRREYADMALSAMTLEKEAIEYLRKKARGQPPVSTDAPLIFQPAQPRHEYIGESYDVLADGVAIGFISQYIGAAVGAEPWTWAIEYFIEDHTPAHGSAPTREAAFAAFANWWRRRK
jgi:hypothetical protein